MARKWNLWQLACQCMNNNVEFIWMSALMIIIITQNGWICMDYDLYFELQKDYAFGYDVHEYDEYGNPNVHSRTETREGYNVKGTNIYILYIFFVQCISCIDFEYFQGNTGFNFQTAEPRLSITMLTNTSSIMLMWNTRVSHALTTPPTRTHTMPQSTQPHTTQLLTTSPSPIQPHTTQSQLMLQHPNLTQPHTTQSQLMLQHPNLTQPHTTLSQPMPQPHTTQNQPMLQLHTMLNVINEQDFLLKMK